MRLFWALELPDSHRAAVMDVIDRIRRADPRAPVRWVRKEELHVTLKFIGDADEDKPMVAAVRHALAGVAPFELALGSGGSFGGARPRVLWLGVGGPGLPDLKALAETMEVACLGAGFPRDEREFHAHVTLGRVQQGRQNLGPLKDALRRATAPGSLGPFKATRAVLFESTLEQGRPPVYTPRAEVDLGGAPK